MPAPPARPVRRRSEPLCMNQRFSACVGSGRATQPAADTQYAYREELRCTQLRLAQGCAASDRRAQPHPAMTCSRWLARCSALRPATPPGPLCGISHPADDPRPAFDRA
ncbi:MAG: hypothetical protein KatS3mg057_0901 [Herpetosiphonaceae bacterium]|nr:MAG: hypothetical protein KatS3mg057_0901 [Herpetosiphonaceae bacterium]